MPFRSLCYDTEEANLLYIVFEVYFVLHFKLNCCAIVEHFRSFKLYLCGIRYRFLNDPTYVRVGVYVCMFRLFNYLEF